MSEENKEPRAKWTPAVFRNILLGQVADLRERETAIRNRYGGNPPADDSEFQQVMAALESWRKLAAEIERDVLGNPEDEERAIDE